MSDKKGDPRFRALLERIWDLHCKKTCDYGSDTDYLANLRASEGFGIPAWLGAVVRLNDKVFRIQSFAKKGALKNESLEDSLMDISAYGLLALILYQESIKDDDSPSPVVPVEPAQSSGFILESTT